MPVSKSRGGFGDIYSGGIYVPYKPGANVGAKGSLLLPSQSANIGSSRGARLTTAASALTPAQAPALIPSEPIAPTVPTVPPPEEKPSALGGLQSLGPQGGAEGEQLLSPGALRAGLGNRLYPDLSAPLAGLRRIY